ncbi:MAG TPA: threonine ammonia-lyase [Pseudonocardia sp.]|uniref:threonine ammonia-lyase n=1 Tax=Pseudonocardia sp. TaxID=60912 RepID=UPI002C24DFB8|nr:threonine ammonia-lyase [Pseudonocardia sp.]HTF47286.1 threonine ammonia-lyase [Pseudonocardia sp.]
MSTTRSPDWVDLAAIRAAAKLLDGVARRTPLANSRALSDTVGGPVQLKCENLQRTGSFKIRGAYVRMHALTPEERAAGVVAASAGNHAQGVALAARLLGMAATVFMPVRAALPKVAATQAYGADVELVGAALEETLAAAREFAGRTGAHFIHPFDHPAVVAGQGTVGLEICEQEPQVRTVLVPTGGGGLAAGVAAAMAELAPKARVVAVQAAEMAAWPESMSTGRPVRTPARPTIADGIAVAEPGVAPFDVLSRLVGEVLTVSEDSMSRALLHCLERAKLVVEPAGAAGVAALLDNPDRFEPPVVCVLSGGNVDPLLMLHVIQHGMAAAGRYLSARVRLADRPGALAELLALVGELGCNVLDVEHTRISGALALGEVDVALSAETRGPRHRIEVLDALRASGHRVELV